MTGLHRSVTTALRPVYAGYFPRFNVEELHDRAIRLPFHLATQLNPHNIKVYCQHFGWRFLDKYLRLAAPTRRRFMIDVLQSVGISEKTLFAMSRVPREIFVDERFRDFAYLNWSLPLGAGSCLSAPGITAIMCDLLPAGSGTALEIGVGGGYHAHVLLERDPRLTIVGYEATRFIAQRAARIARHRGVDRLHVVNQAFSADTPVPHRLAFAYHTAVSRGPLDNVARAIVDGGHYVLPRALEPSEFLASPADTWLLEQFPSYEQYLATDGASAACVLASYRVKSADGRVKHAGLVQAGQLYGVAFVPWKTGVVSESSIPHNDSLQLLFDAYFRREHE